MGENQEPPKEWMAAAQKVVQGTDLFARVQCSESWDFVGDSAFLEGAVAVGEHNRHYHITVMVPGKEPLTGHGETLEAAVAAARSRVEAYLNEQKGG
jgi:hypothetical protein